jgi:hypothetical protein
LRSQLLELGACLGKLGLRCLAQALFAV